MNLDHPTLAALRTGFSTEFQSGFDAMKATSQWKRLAFFVKSSDKSETYGWLNDMLRMRKWFGPRHIKSLMANAAVIWNEPYEATIGVNRYDIMFDKLGTYGPRFNQMGRVAAENPDQLVWALLKAGFTTNCWDGQFFFDTDHPILRDDGTTSTFANTDGGAGAPWFLVDTSKGILPLVFQQAIAPSFVSRDNLTDSNVFSLNEYQYGTDSYEAAGYAMPQLAWGSKQPLDAARVKTAFETMESLKGGGDQPLGISPNICFVGPTNREAAYKVFKATTVGGGDSNPWKDTVEVIVVPWLA